MAGLRVHFVFPAGLVERVDAALVEGESRGEFVRRAVEETLWREGHVIAPAVEQALVGFGDAPRQRAHTKTEDDVAITPAPAEQPSQPPAAEWEVDLSRVNHYRQLSARSSVQAKRDVRPVPKAGEK